MKKGLKIIIYIVLVIVVSVGLDLGSILLFEKPIFAFKRNDDSVHQVYHGLFYDTYNCFESTKVKIVSKTTKFTCPTIEENIVYGKITEIKNDMVVIIGIKKSIYLDINEEAHILISDNPKIIGANNLIVGQCVEVQPTIVAELYPIRITTKEIKIVESVSQVEESKQ